MKKLACALIVSTTTTSCFITTEQRAPGVSIDVAAASKYVFRGVTLNDSAVAQLRAATALPTEQEEGFLVLETWANVDLDDDTGRSDWEAWFPEDNGFEVTESRQTIAYQGVVGNGLPVSAGLTTYSWPSGVWSDDYSAEVFARIAGPEVLGFVPSAELRVDIDSVHGYYARLGASRAFEISQSTTGRVGVTVGASDEDHSQWFYGADSDGLADAQVTLGIDHSVNESTTVFLEGSHSTFLDDDIDDALEESPRDVDGDPTWFRLGVRWSF